VEVVPRLFVSRHAEFSLWDRWRQIYTSIALCGSRKNAKGGRVNA